MKTLWTYLDCKAWRAETKYRAAFYITGTLFALAGAAVWLIIKNWALSTWDWMVCFIGYPALFAWFLVLYYMCRHEFHNGKPKE